MALLCHVRLIMYLSAIVQPPFIMWPSSRQLTSTSQAKAPAKPQARRRPCCPMTARNVISGPVVSSQTDGWGPYKLAKSSSA
eukprot:scaffold468338_cov42-Prasinocladus_malaysianus.AAC.1